MGDDGRQKFMVTLSCISNLRPAWTTWDPVPEVGWKDFLIFRVPQEKRVSALSQNVLKLRVQAVSLWKVAPNAEPCSLSMSPPPFNIKSRSPRCLLKFLLYGFCSWGGTPAHLPSAPKLVNQEVGWGWCWPLVTENQIKCEMSVSKDWLVKGKHFPLALFFFSPSDLFSVYECFTCKYVCVLHGCLVPAKIRRRYWMPQEW